jgi:uncharacterized protein YacL
MLFGTKRTFVLDYQSLADPRIAGFLGFGFISGRLVAPEPGAGQASEHVDRRARETIDRLKTVKGLTVKLDRKLHDRKALVAAVKKEKAMLITTDAELKAAVGGAGITAAEIYDLFKPQYLPGAELKIRIAKKGKEKGEGIGYLEGGIKVVVEDGAASVGADLEVVIQGALDTDVGRVVFAKPRFTELN